MIPDWTGITEQLKELIPLPEDGFMELMHRKKDLFVLLWKFETTTACSLAKEQNFINIKSPQKFWEIPTLPQPNATTFFLPFFTLFSGSGPPYHGFIYPETSEDERLQALRTSLTKGDCSFRTFPKHFEAYCRFSGGGDLCIEKSVEPGPFVVVTPEDNEVVTPEDNEEQGSDDEQPSVENPIPSTSNKLSPPTLGTAKRLDYLKWQLWANMFTYAVGTFVDKIKKMEKNELIKVNELNTYGMGLTGDGTVGVYKLLFTFCGDRFRNNEKQIDKVSSTQLIEKMKLGTRDRLEASQLADYALSHYLNQTI